MRKRSDLMSTDYSYSSFLKAGAVFFTTTVSYCLFFSLHWQPVGSSQVRKKKDEITFDEAKSSHDTYRRTIEQLKATQAYPTNLSSLDGSNGYLIIGLNAGDQLGSSVSMGGDFNGDGLADFALGAYSASPGARAYAGIVYVIYGQKSGSLPRFNLTTLNGINGFSIPGLSAGDQLGTSISISGDINGDGLVDLLIAASAASPSGHTGAGTVYVVFGSRNTFLPSLDLSKLNGTNGFMIPGLNPQDRLASSVSTAGDLNGDGLADIILGNSFASSGGSFYGGPGCVYVVFGRMSGWPISFNLATLNGGNGFIMLGPAIGTYALGSSVSTTGDFNGDGITDMLIGASGAPGGLCVISSSCPGVVYALFGKRSSWPASFNLTNLNGTDGFSISSYSGINLGSLVSIVGDINGDGLFDLGLVANPTSFPSSYPTAYILFGKVQWSSTFDLNSLNGSNGFAVLKSSITSSCAISLGGDFNGDGIGDLLLGVNGLEYDVVFGQKTWPANYTASVLNGMNGFVFSNPNASRAYPSGSLLGDINGDGFSDIVLASGDASLSSGPNGPNAGAVYVIFGTPHNLLLFQNNDLTLIENQTVVLTPENLSFNYSIYKNNYSLLFTSSNLQHGYFELTTNPGTPIVSFTQAELLNQMVQFVHDGTTNPPAYAISASYESFQSQPVMANIIFSMGTAPVLANHHFTIATGASVILSSSDLSAYDTNLYGAGNGTLVFQISNLQHGQFELLSLPNISVMQFIQDQIRQGLVQFVHDGSGYSPSATLVVNNSFLLASTPAPLLITFIANGTNSSTVVVTPGSSSDVTGAIAGGAVGGALLLAGAIGGGFWYRKYAQDARTRKQYRFADDVREALKLKGIENFESEKGQHYLAVIQKLETELSTQGGMTLSEMGEGDLKVLAKQVAGSARNKITSSTTMFGYSIIKPEDLNDRKISEIVQDVLRMRVGQSDTYVSMSLK